MILGSKKDSDGWTIVKRKKGYNEKEKQKKNGVQVFVDLETICVEDGVDPRGMRQKILEILEEIDKKYYPVQINGFDLYKDGEDYGGMVKVVHRDGMSVKLYHKRNFMCSVCREAQQNNKPRLKKYNLLEIDMLIEVCKEAMELQLKGDHKVIMVISNDPIFTENLFQSLTNLGFTVVLKIPDCMIKIPMFKTT